jgi:hypothetical protein
MVKAEKWTHEDAERRPLSLRVLTEDGTSVVNHTTETRGGELEVLKSSEKLILNKFQSYGWWNISHTPEDFEIIGVRLIIKRKAEK